MQCLQSTANSLLCSLYSHQDHWFLIKYLVQGVTNARHSENPSSSQHSLIISPKNTSSVLGNFSAVGHVLNVLELGRHLRQSRYRAYVELESTCRHNLVGHRAKARDVRLGRNKVLKREVGKVLIVRDNDRLCESVSSSRKFRVAISATSDTSQVLLRVTSTYRMISITIILYFQGSSSVITTAQVYTRTRYVHPSIHLEAKNIKIQTKVSSIGVSCRPREVKKPTTNKRQS